MTSPADELRAAAEKLHTLVADLEDCRGPWYIVNEASYPQRIDNIGVPYVVATTTTDPGHPPDIARYISAMHPGVGHALADLLDDQADGDDEGVINPWALAVARALNGDTR